MAVCTKKKEVNKYLHDKELAEYFTVEKTAVSPTKEEEGPEEKDTRMKRQAAMAIIHHLSTKFELFFKQWTQQVEMILELIDSIRLQKQLLWY